MSPENPIEEDAKFEMVYLCQGENLTWGNTREQNTLRIRFHARPNPGERNVLLVHYHASPGHHEKVQLEVTLDNVPMRYLPKEGSLERGQSASIPFDITESVGNGDHTLTVVPRGVVDRPKRNSWGGLLAVYRMRPKAEWSRPAETA